MSLLYWNTMTICRDIADALQLLINDLQEGRKRHRSYQQLHMYNDPEMNVYLNKAERRLTG